MVSSPRGHPASCEHWCVQFLDVVVQEADVARPADDVDDPMEADQGDGIISADNPHGNQADPAAGAAAEDDALPPVMDEFPEEPDPALEDGHLSEEEDYQEELMNE